ncbi:MAG: hypothetical protein PVJ02_05090 [Gemmatimonadota bacterium]|jgi:methyl-accepting chemotaxis protein
MDLNQVSALQGLVADTVVTVQARDSLTVAVNVALLVSATAMAVLALVLVRLLVQWRRTLGQVRTAVDQNLGPVSERMRVISDNVQFITQALRTDVERLNASVRALTDRLHQASERMEERIEEFNALMEVVQSEAEDIFLDTAATVRGVKAGARAAATGRGLPTDWKEAADRALEELEAGTDPGEEPPEDTVDAGAVPAEGAGER